MSHICLMPPVSRLPSPVSSFQSHNSCLIPSVSRLWSHLMSHAPVPCLLSHASCLLSPVWGVKFLRHCPLKKIYNKPVPVTIFFFVSGIIWNGKAWTWAGLSCSRRKHAGTSLRGWRRRWSTSPATLLQWRSLARRTMSPENNQVRNDL